MTTSTNLPGAIEKWHNNPDPSSRALWSYLDVMDAAVVIRLALQTTMPGHQVFYVAAPETFVEEQTERMLRKC